MDYNIETWEKFKSDVTWFEFMAHYIEDDNKCNMYQNWK